MLRLKEHRRAHWPIFIILALVAAGNIFFQWQGTTQLVDAVTIEVVATPTKPLAKVSTPRGKPTLPSQVKAVYLTAYSAGNSRKIDEIIALIDRTELNAVVIDIKDYSGLVLFDTSVPLAKEIGAVDNRIGNLPALIQKLHEKGIYVIARQTVFQDPLLAKKKPTLAIQSKNGGIWYDNKGLSWVDATHKEIWEYNAAIAKDAIHYGFDEVNFDYVRFPSDGNMALVVYTGGELSRSEVMHQFYTYLGDELTAEPAYISVDFFGFVMERHDGMSIGQRLEDAVDVVDFISPMMYPSHYPSGHLGLDNPAAHPGVVIDNGMTKGIPSFTDHRAKARPWLQAFNLGATYGAANIRAQIDMVEKYDNAGWLLWNASNRYTDAGLKAEK